MYPELKQVLCAFLFVLCSYLYWSYYKFTRRFRNFPSQTVTARHLFELCFRRNFKDTPYTTVAFKRILNIAEKCQKEGIFVIWFFQPVVFVFGEEYMKILLNDNSLLNKPIFYSIVTGGVGKGLLTHNESVWRKRRKMINPAFRPEVLRNAVCILNSVARDVVKQLSELSSEPNPDAITVLRNGTLKALCGAAFEMKNINKNNEKEFMEVGVATERLGAFAIYRGTRPWMYFRKFHLLSEKGWNIKQYHATVKNFTKKLVEQMLESDSSSISKSDKSEDVQCNENVESRKRLPHIFLENHKKDPSFTFKAIQGEVQTLLLAGHDSTSLAMLWTLFMLAVYPEVQDKAFEEIQSVKESTDTDFSHNDLNELRYLESVIKETLRIYPSVPIFFRKATKDVQCGRYRIPKDTCILFFSHLLHRDPNIYPEPEKFDPERFYESNMKYPWAYVPFAEGVRNCIGKNFAMLEMKIFLAHILLNFKITTPDRREDIQLDWRITLQPSKPIRFKFTSRQSQSSLEG